MILLSLRTNRYNDDRSTKVTRVNVDRKVSRTEKAAMSSIGHTFRVAAIFLACATLAGLLGCKQEAASTPARPIPEVPVVTVSPGTMPDEPVFIGQTEASRPVEIRSQVTGILKERFFAEGRD